MRRSILLMSVVALIIAGPLSASAYAAPGDLDQAFGAAGVAYVDIGADTTVLRAGVQADGGVVLVCEDAGALYLMRLTPDGQVDATFGTAGRTALDFTFDTAYWPAGHVWVQPMTGRIVIEGHAYTATGLPDASYGGSGHPASGEVGAMTADGGFIWVSGPTITRLTPDGALDTSFGDNGTRAISISDIWPIDHANAAMVDKQGRILILGGIGPQGGAETFILRLLPDGRLDTSFTGDGFEIDSWWKGVHILTQGPGDWIYALWCTARGMVDEFEVNRIAPDGATAQPQTLFGVGDGVSAWTLLPDGTWVLGGSVNHGFPYYFDVGVRRFTPLGLPDETFANGGQVAIDLGAWNDTAYVIARPDGRILVAGATQENAPAALGFDASPSPRTLANATPQLGMVAQLQGGKRTGLATVLRISPSSTPVTLRLVGGRAKWTTTGLLTCHRTRVGAVRLSLQRSKNGASWTTLASGKTGRNGSVTKTATLTRRGTYYLRWRFSGTTSYVTSVSRRIKIVVK